MTTAALTGPGRFAVRRKGPITRIVGCIGILAAATAGVVAAFHARQHAADAAAARTSYMLVRAGAAHEEAYLLNLQTYWRAPSVRNTFFDATQEETTLLSAAGRNAPGPQLRLVDKLEQEHTEALTAVARALSGSKRRAQFGRALRLLQEVQLDAATAEADLVIADVEPWPTTTADFVELSALALVLLAGVLSLARQLFRAAGLRHHPAHAELEQLLHVARSDSLTGLANHRAFQHDLPSVIDRRNAAGIPFSLLACDLDELKRVNDLEGHPAGDVYIKTVAASIRDEVGESGTVYRTGGDEFMVILPDCRGWEALTVAHRIQATATERTGRRALSIGLTESAHTESARALLRQADLALYEAKRAKLLAVTYHDGLEPRTIDPAATGPTSQQKAVAAALAQAVDAKDAVMRNHSETVAELSVAIARRLGFAGERLERLRIAGLLHDVGKLAISDNVLTKPGALAPAERTEVEIHATVGHTILASAGLAEEARWVLHHHERIDGTGYPARLAGEAIPLESRVLAVADAFEAMTGTRSYRNAVSPEEALAELAANSGTQFDTRCVEVLNDVFGGGPLPAAHGDAGAVIAVA